MLCKKCNIVMRHKLIQSGMADPKSYKCYVCDTLHDSKGNLFDPDKHRGANTMSGPKCPKCGSDNIERDIMSGWLWCKDCKSWVII